MCTFIYITTVGKTPKHERVCATAGHEMHSEIYADEQWRAN